MRPCANRLFKIAHNRLESHNHGNSNITRGPATAGASAFFRKLQKQPRRLMINFAQRRIGCWRSISQCSDGDALQRVDGDALQRVHEMRRRAGKLCYDRDIDANRDLIPTTLVTAERFSAAVTFLMHPPEDNLASALSERDERLLTAYHRAFGGRLNHREANRLLGCLGWVQF